MSEFQRRSFGEETVNYQGDPNSDHTNTLKDLLADLIRK
jgi:hypothetical protein